MPYRVKFGPVKRASGVESRHDPMLVDMMGDEEGEKVPW